MRKSVSMRTEPLNAALDQLRLDGAIYFRAEFTESWAYESPPKEIAGFAAPRRGTAAHVSHRGRGPVLGRSRGRRTTLGVSGRRHRASVRRPALGRWRRTGGSRPD